MQQRYRYHHHHTSTGSNKVVVSSLLVLVLVLTLTTTSSSTSSTFVSSLRVSFSSMNSLKQFNTRTCISLVSNNYNKNINNKCQYINNKCQCTMSSLKNAASVTAAGGGDGDGNVDVDVDVDVDIVQQDTSATTKSTSFQSLASRIDNSWIRELSSETIQNIQLSLQVAGEGINDTKNNNNNNSNNKFRRQVFNGHYVLVQPTGILNPELVLYSPDVAYNLLQLSKEQVSDPNFTKWVSGNLPNGINGINGISSDSTTATQEVSSWATPYALSIVGTRYTSNCPYGTGNGYGDGRAISIAEIQVDTTATTNDKNNEQQQQRIYDRYELQLKGSGKTPFCRGADGRAILRSSIREFLASEAMHYLHVPTTRALSLVVSKKETVMRPWYTDNTKLQLPDRTDPRLQKYTVEQQKELVSQLREQNRADPNIMQSEPVAITCRVSPNFIRIGHFDLFTRRVEQVRKNSNQYDTTTIQYTELEQLIWHACEREYNTIAYQPYIGTNDISSAATALLQQSAIDIATMIGHWIRVGFVQGNFNADNNLISGRTMDYGPFGYVEEYNPIAAKWTGSGDHFGFFNQMSAGLYNYKILVESILPVILATSTTTNDTNENLETRKETLIESFMDTASELFQNTMDETLRIKLGFNNSDSTTTNNTTNGDDIVWKQLEPLLRSSRTDWTIFFRSLTYTIRDFPLPILLSSSSSSSSVGVETNDKYLYDQILASLEGTIVNSNNDDTNTINNDYPGSFYEPLTTKQRKEWIEWIGLWRNALIQSTNTNTTTRTSDDIYNTMKNNNPKYVLREWMLVNAYKQAQSPLWNFTEIQQLFTLLQNPYDEGTTEQIQQYYTRASDDVLALGGTAFMSCSS